MTAPLNDWGTSLFLNQQKKLSIRYIGFSIVVSVGAGIATTELIRMRQKQQQRHSDLMQLMENPVAAQESEAFPADQSADPTDPLYLTDALATVEWQINSEEPYASSPSSATRLHEEQQPIAPLPRRAEALALGQLSPAPPGSDQTPLSPALTESINQSARQSAKRFQSLRLKTLEEVNQHTCRIQVQGAQERLLALQVEGQYYSFSRVRPLLDQALSVVAMVEKRGEKAIATPHLRGYAIWIYQPQAQPDDTEWQDSRLSA